MKNLLKLANNFYKLCAQKIDKIYLTSLSPKEKFKYLSNLGYLFIDDGGKRAVFAISSKRAIKISKEYNNFQNENEYENLTKISSPLLPKIYDKAKNYSWIEVELVRPLKSIKEFEQLTGINYEEFRDIAINSSAQMNKTLSLKEILIIAGTEVYNDKNYFIKYIDNYFINEFYNLFSKSNTTLSEISRIDNLGKNSDGNVIVLDLGL